jgi:hypothetical protein
MEDVLNARYNRAKLKGTGGLLRRTLAPVAVSAVFTVLAQSFSTLNPALGPSFDYLINVLECFAQDVTTIPNQKK